MTIGTGIFASTVLLILAAAVWQITLRSKWKVVGKVSAVAIGFLSVPAVGVWGWIKYQERPTLQRALDGVALGMSPTEVRLQKGAPSHVLSIPTLPPGYELEKIKSGNDLFDPWVEFLESEKPWDRYKNDPIVQADPRRPAQVEASAAIPNDPIMRWLFADAERSAALTVVFFTDSKVSGTCRRYSYNTILGIAQGTEERDVVAKLGAPTNVSIYASATTKLIWYERWSAAFEFEEARVISVCVADKPVKYSNPRWPLQIPPSVATSTSPT